MLLLPTLVLIAACSLPGAGQPSVVIYTSVDQVFSEPTLEEFEAQTGIRVLPVYDVEAAKTTGLVTRLIAEKGRPQADVFWSGEIAQAIASRRRASWRPTTPPAPMTSPRPLWIPSTTGSGSPGAPGCSW